MNLSGSKIDRGSGARALVRRAVPAGAQEASPDARARASHKGAKSWRRNPLHGWRLLAGPLVVQMLLSGIEPIAAIPAALAQRRYRERAAKRRPGQFEETA